MFKTSHHRFIESVSVLLVALSFISQLAACATDSYAAKGAAKGATELENDAKKLNPSQRRELIELYLKNQSLNPDDPETDYLMLPPPL